MMASDGDHDDQTDDTAAENEDRGEGEEENVLKTKQVTAAPIDDSDEDIGEDATSGFMFKAQRTACRANLPMYCLH